jgi:hypothetical protein
MENPKNNFNMILIISIRVNFIQNLNKKGNEIKKMQRDRALKVGLGSITLFNIYKTKLVCLAFVILFVLE